MWENADTHAIRIGGNANGYDANHPVIVFDATNKLKIERIFGSSGQIFGTFDKYWEDKLLQPSFQGLFAGATNLKGSVPENLFGGIYGQPVNNMFNSTFAGCSGLETMPETLFDGILTGDVQQSFSQMFTGCTSLTGPALRNGNGQFLHDEFPSSGPSAYAGTKINGLTYIPTAWGGLGILPIQPSQPDSEI